MSWEAYLVVLTLLLALAGFISERFSLTAMASFVLILLASASLTGSELLGLKLWQGVFTNSAPLTILGMFVLSAALERCGLIDYFTTALRRASKLPYRYFLVLLIIAVGGASAFINNTPVVVILTPVVISLAREMGKSPSKVLIPLSYASIFGGMCTLIGSSTNILANGVLQQEGLAVLGMFELGKIGLPAFALALAYFIIFGEKLLPERDTLTSLLPEEHRKEFVTSVVVKNDSRLLGKSFLESRVGGKDSVKILQLRRGGGLLKEKLETITLQAADQLLLASCSTHLTHLAEEGLRPLREQNEKPLGQEALIAEAIVGPNCPLIGKTIGQTSLKDYCTAKVLAIHRKGQQLRHAFEQIPLRFGDTLLLIATQKDLQKLSDTQKLSILDSNVRTIRSHKKLQIYIMSLLMLGFILTVSFQKLPISLSIALVCLCLLGTRILSLPEAIRAVQWPIILLIYSMLALGAGMESTGTTTYLVKNLIEHIRYLPEDYRAYASLAILYLSANLLTELLSNQATILLMAPVAISLGTYLGIDPRPLVITVCIASSASFAFPLGYQTNTYIYNVGGYQFKDFFRIGLPLNLLYGLLCLLLVPLIWPF